MTSGSKRRRLIPYLLIIVLALPGCSSERIVDRIHILTVLGFDKSDSGFSGTGLYSDFTQKGEIILLQGKSTKPTLLLNEMNYQSSQPIMSGKLEMLLFDKHLAEDGIAPFIQTICKDPLLSHYLIVAVSDGSAASMMKSLVNQKRESLPYHMVNQNIQSGRIPKSNLQTLLFDYYGEGRDPSIPYLKLNQKGNIEITGYGIFKDDRLKLILTSKEIPLYKMLQGRLMLGDVPFTITRGQDKGTAVFSGMNGRGSRAVSKSESGIKIIYNITMSGMIKDYPKWTDLRSDGNDKQLIMQLEKHISSELSMLLYKFREDKVDPLGVGDLIRAHNRIWNEKQFYKVEYPKIRFEVNVKAHLTKSGIAE